MYTGEFLSLGCALAWSIGSIFLKKSTQSIHPMAMSFYGCLIALFIYLVSFDNSLIQTLKNLTAIEALFLFLSAVAGIVLGGYLHFRSLNLIGVTNTALMECLYIPLVAILSFVFLSERIDSLQFFGIALVLLSTLIIGLKSEGSTNQKRLKSKKGIIIGILCQVFLAVSVITLKPVLASVDGESVALVRIFLASILMTILICFLKSRRKILKSVKLNSFFSLFLGTALCTGLATFLWIEGMRYTMAIKSAVIVQTSTIFSIILATLFLKESFGKDKLCATLLATAGVFLVAV